MKKINLFFVFLCVVTASWAGLSYAEATDIQGLVTSFYKATDLQREGILQSNLGKDISGSGAISNVGEYDFFDTGTDFKATYYQVSTALQKTKNNIPYQLIFLFKEKDKVKDLNKGNKFKSEGKVIRILDERLQITVWLLCADLTEKEKSLFNQN